MNGSKQLLELKEYGEAVLQALPREVPPENHLAALVKKIEQTARQVVAKASSPVKIGVVGEFSSGKTVLLGGLIGCGDALPASPTPSTGNITALRFVPDEGVLDTRPKKFQVEYLDQGSIEDCLTFLIGVLRGRARAAELASPLAQALDGLRGDAQGVWSALPQWCKQVWLSSNNPGLRLLLREVLAFARAHNACGQALAGQTFTVDGPVAAEGLLLGTSQEDLQKLSFDRLPVPEPIDRRPEALTARQLRDSFSLIRRVEVEVRLPSSVWDLSEVRGGNEFVLLDFPGLGAANSGARDTYLCLRELDEVQTILILVNGSRPGGREALDIFDMMQQRRGSEVADCVLVGISRFDQLPLASQGGEQILADLAGGEAAAADALGLELESEAGPLDEARVCGELRVLQEVVARARELTQHPDRVVVLSAMYALHHLQQRCPDLRVGGATFLTELTGHSGEALRLLPVWRRLAERLEQGGGKSTGLAAWLKHYCRDGGRLRLQELLGDHVRTHGLRQQYLAVKELAEDLAKDVLRLKHAAVPDNPSAAPPPDLKRLQQTINGVARIYQSLATDYEKNRPELHLDPEGLLRAYEALEKEFDLPRPMLPPTAAPLLQVADVVREEITHHIFRWPQWRDLLIKVRGGRITVVAGGEKEDDWLTLEEEEGTKLPERSDDLFPAFETTLKQMEAFARACVREAVPNLLKQLSRRLAEPRQELQGAWQGPDREQQLRASGGVPAVNAAKVLRSALGLKELEDSLVKDFSAQEGGSATLRPQQLFPLPRADGKHPTGRAFPWASHLGGDTRGGGHHQVLLLRLRDTFVVSANQAVGQLVSDLTKSVVAKLVAKLQQLGVLLTERCSQAKVLNALATAHQSGGQPAAENPYARLAAVRPPL